MAESAKKPKSDSGGEQTPGHIEAEGETGVEGKGGGPSVGQKKSKITKKCESKGGCCILYFAVEG